MSASEMSARSAETGTGSVRQDASAVPQADALVIAAITSFRLEERHQEAVDAMSTRKWRTPMRLITHERTTDK